MKFTGPMKYNLKAMGLAVGSVLTEHVKSQSSSSRNACLSFQSVCTVKKWIKINVINKKKNRRSPKKCYSKQDAAEMGTHH